MNIIRTWNVSLGPLQRHREGFKSAIKKILFILQNVNIFHSDIQLLIKNNTTILRVSLMILLGTPSPWISEFLVACPSPCSTAPCPIGWPVLPRRTLADVCLRLCLPAMGCRAGGPSWGTSVAHTAGERTDRLGPSFLSPSHVPGLTQSLCWGTGLHQSSGCKLGLGPSLGSVLCWQFDSAVKHLCKTVPVGRHEWKSLAAWLYWIQN